MQTAVETLAEANDCHDDDPQRAATLLRKIDIADLPASEQPLYAFLLNHVLGEKLDEWTAAHAGMSRLLAGAGEAATPVLWRHAAVAATLSGATADAHRASTALAQATSVSPAQAGELVRLASAAFTVGSADAEHSGRDVLEALSSLQAPHWQLASALDTAAAASCNNIAATLSERPVADLQEPALRQALMSAAQCSQRLWQRCGTWVNRERACYGMAVAALASGDAAAGLDAARQGLALLDQHDAAGEQTVDRAFLELELSFACQRLGQNDEAVEARRRADTLATAFEEQSLKDWFAERVARNELLAAG